MPEPSRPNIIVIISHDLGRHLNCYGVETVHSPNLDAFAAEGVKFDRMFCTAPQCSPSRASMFTGRYPHSNGVMGLVHSDFAWDLHDNETHLAKLLGEAGYHTACVGDVHETSRPGQFGFQQTLVTGGGTCFKRLSPIVDFLHDRKESPQPFYLQIGFFEPHRARPGFGHPPDTRDGVTVPPYLVDDLDAREDFAYYEGAIRALDDTFGMLDKTLRDTGLTDDTLVVFAADHGIPFPRAKCSIYDPGLEITFLMRWPNGPWDEGRTCDALLNNADFLPTMCDLLELDAPGGVQGGSFLPALQGDAGPHEGGAIFGEMTYHDYPDPRRCIRTETHKLIANFANAPFFMDPSQGWRRKTVTKHPENPPFAYHVPVELYDLEADPLEQNNLVDSPDHAELLAELGRQLHQWMADTNDPLLEGIPAPPMHGRTLRALREGVVPLPKQKP